MREFRLLLAVFAALALSACNGVPLSTQWKLRHFDLGTADISKLRVALRAPGWTTPTPGKTVLEATLAPRSPESGERKLKIHLHQGLHLDDTADIAHIGNSDTPFAIYEIAPRDLAAARAFQEEAQKRKQEGGSGKGSGIKLQSGVACRRGEIPDGPILIDAYIHVDDETGWLPLLEGLDVRPSLTSSEAWRAFDEVVPVC